MIWLGVLDFGLVFWVFGFGLGLGVKCCGIWLRGSGFRLVIWV